MELTYTRSGDYEIPDIALRRTGSSGHYGRLRREYLREHRPVIFNTLVLSERLYPHLQEVEQRAHDRMDELSVEKLCTAFECSVDDILEFIELK